MADTDRRAPHERLADRLKGQITSGHLPPGAELPGVRQLAETHGLASATVQRALTTLRQEGFIVTTPRQGSRVASDPPNEASDVDPGAHIRRLSERVAALEARVSELEHVDNQSEAEAR